MGRLLRPIARVVRAPDSHLVSFRCNICGKHNAVAQSLLGREIASCGGCGSSVRARSVVHMLTTALYGRSRCLRDVRRDRSITGCGLSDWSGYAAPLAKLFSYRNTFLHCEPLLDITAPPPSLAGQCDFLISSEVFEHVPPPVSRAFDGAFSLLKPGGHLILTVPYSHGDVGTEEHYPTMQDFATFRIGDTHGVVVLDNAGGYSVDSKPIFHGGPGQTLEMRLFGERGLRENLAASGFENVIFLAAPEPESGIVFAEPWSRPILARRPA